MKRASARAKGKEFEKTTGEVVGKWWCGISFPRAHGSGSATTLQCKHQAVEGQIFHHSGDLYVPDGFPWSIECKRQEGWSIEQLFEGKCPHVFSEWWEQCCRDADLTRRWPLLIMKRDHRKPLIMVETDSPFDLSRFIHNRTIIQRDGEAVLLCLLEEFLTRVTPSDVPAGLVWRSRSERIQQRKERKAALCMPSVRKEM